MAALALAGCLLAVAVVAGTGLDDAAEPGRVGHKGAEEPGALHRVHTTERLVALSFDDGPDPRFTPTVLSLLRAKGAHATFFVEGRAVVAFPALAREEIAQGHEVANHTWDHPDIRRIAAGSLVAEVQQTSLALRTAGVPESPLFRAPFGNLDTASAAVVRSAWRGPMTIVGWDRAVEHALRLNGQDPTQAAARLLSQIRPGDIILAHDGGLDRTRTVRTLGLLLDGLRQRSLTVVTVGRLLGASRVSVGDEAAAHARAR